MKFLVATILLGALFRFAAATPVFDMLPALKFVPFVNELADRTGESASQAAKSEAVDPQSGAVEAINSEASASDPFNLAEV
ncbi:hypothetical protein PtA15_12A227 [Puccinia triticina]|uniref:Uncharacterized protein n=2 Tax=Puccinia triticina TaxID=208348 RepID=A0ABY7D022_9BASI|nr:uncharacterized protein PtA15_12A227 [Puccinia triticina]WAQ90240.1 hypothetical protein PtA15_12A227 [Puccinia triticina]WAR61546.1 hypothetical protein PtB15_12B236 [Puccinia triticina]